jgi:probable rRNA maturation factor
MMTTPSNIEISNEYDFPINEARLREAAVQVLRQHGRDFNTELTLVVTNNEQVQGLNAQFRGVNTPTDVLSFPAEMADEDVPPGEAHYLGDILIAHPYALAQAEREGHDPNDSMSLLVVHGVLHLLGYDHDTPEHRTAMWEAQAEALNILNISTALVPALEEANHPDEDESTDDESE